MVTRNVNGGFKALRLHSAPGVLGQVPAISEHVTQLLGRASSVELVRFYHGRTVHGDMAGDLGAVYAGDEPRPDLTMVTLAAVLRAAGIRVLIRDQNATQDQLPPVEKNVGLRIVKVQLPTWQRDISAAQRLQASDSQTPVVLIGAVVSHLPIDHGLLTVKGDAPTAFAEALEIESIEIGDAYSLFPLDCYRDAESNVRVHLASSHGCDRTCRYCPYIRIYGRWSARTIEDFRADIRRLLDLGVSRVQLRDQDFPSDLQHAEAVTAAMAEVAAGRIKWTVEGNLDRFTPGLLGALKAAATEEVIVGLESANADILKVSRRKVITESDAFIGHIRAAGLRARGLFVIGLPGDSWKSVLATVRMALSSELTAAQFNAYAPLPGEKFGNSKTATVEDYVPLTNDFRYRTCVAMSQKEVRLASRLAFRAFNADREGRLRMRDEYLARINGRASE